LWRFFYLQLPAAQPVAPELSSVLNIAEVLLAHWFLFRFYERSRADAYAELERLSETDKLTGLFNRRHLDILLTQEFNMHKRTEAPLSLILCDIDHFKRINDKYGHLTGDSILQEIGSILRATMRGTDICGRWGGEEFLIICPDTSLEGAVVIIAKLQDALNQQHFAKDIKVTLSFGVAASAVPIHQTAINPPSLCQKVPLCSCLSSAMSPQGPGISITDRGQIRPPRSPSACTINPHTLLSQFIALQALMFCVLNP
jgi:diguanylate cyclase (GGDEF)-like protein